MKYLFNTVVKEIVPMSIKDTYDIILSNLPSFEPDLIYFSVGCAVNSPRGYINLNNESGGGGGGGQDSSESVRQSSGRITLNPNTHQQYPGPIMTKYEGKKKCIILMDYILEENLEILNVLPSLELLEQDSAFRMFSNHDTLVIAIKKPFFFTECAGRDGEQFPDDYSFLISLIAYTIHKDKKLIVQNFSGHEIEKPYINLFDFFPKASLLKKVIFDVSNNQEVCQCDFSKYPVIYDDEDNFVQSKFDTLVKLKRSNPKSYKYNLLLMMTDVKHHLCRKLRVFRGEVEENHYSSVYLKRYELIYGVSSEVSEENIMKIIKVILQDIFNSLGLDSDPILLLEASGFKQNNVINTLASLPLP